MVRLSLSDLQKGILDGNRMILSRAITLVESNLDEDQDLANELVQNLLSHTGNSIRVGITGVPGVGKSTFIDAFGNYITNLGKKIAVLAIDPTSQVSKGSILGDKTRMEILSKNPQAFIRPTATGNHLGGVANKTKEAILLCEAAGYEVIIVETVGVGQSEFAVKEVVDFFLLLMLAGAGDELQGIKKGIIEMADGIVITKADGDNLKRARQAQADYQHALHLVSPANETWKTEVLISSAVENIGVMETWKLINQFVQATKDNHSFEHKRQLQNLEWLQRALDERLRKEIMKSPKLAGLIRNYESEIAERKIAAGKAAQLIWNEFSKLLSER